MKAGKKAGKDRGQRLTDPYDTRAAVTVDENPTEWAERHERNYFRRSEQA
jgi:hypothetical protein